MAEPQPDAPRAYDVRVADGVLTIVVQQEFDLGTLDGDWARAVWTRHPGPFPEVRIDLSGCGLVSSTFFAGLIQLRHRYAGSGCARVVLVRPDPRLLRNLAMLRLEPLFAVEPRP